MHINNVKQVSYLTIFDNINWDECLNKKNFVFKKFVFWISVNNNAYR